MSSGLSTTRTLSDASSASDKEERGKRSKAACISQVANWSQTRPAHLFDKIDAFIPEVVHAQVAEASPKIATMLDKIRKLDEADMREYGHLFKHMIFTGVSNSSYGAKIVASTFIAAGYELIFEAAHDTGVIRHKHLEPIQAGAPDRLALLLSKPLYGRPMTVNFKKRTLELFNQRPENVHGDLVRFICLDGGFREGIDIFDIKYIHLLEPTPVKADERQAIGRGTRYCGQKGIAFDPKRGWPLHVFRYEVNIPVTVQHYLENAATFTDLQLKFSDIDLRQVVFAGALEEAAIDSAVDKQLNKAVHDFKVAPDSHSRSHSSSHSSPHVRLLLNGGSSSPPYLALPPTHTSTPSSPYTPSSPASVSPTPIHKSSAGAPPLSIMNHRDMDEYVLTHFSGDAYGKATLENKCLDGGAKQVVAAFSPTQNFARRFFQPASAYKGLLLYHSVGTGKTCSGIAVASTSFEKEGYTILWVTRHTLKADITKNMLGIVCSIPLQERLRKGLKVTNANVSKNWLKPISYKQFSNMLLKRNQIYHDMVARNGAADPLRKTLVIIDEAHKIYGPDTPAAEKPDTDILEQMINKSYTESGKDSVRLLLMTATPYTKSGIEMIQLLNLMRPVANKLPRTYDDFSTKYLLPTGEFKPIGRLNFIDDMSGYISYLNRSADARNFAYPIIHDIRVDMSLTKIRNAADKFNKFTKEMKELRKGKAAAREADKTAQGTCIDVAKTVNATAKAAIAAQKAAATERKKVDTEACNAIPNAVPKATCKAAAKEAYDQVVEQTKADTAAAKEVLAEHTRACKDVKAFMRELEEKVLGVKERYDILKAKKKEISNVIEEHKDAIVDIKARIDQLKKDKVVDMRTLKAMADGAAKKAFRKAVNEKYKVDKELRSEMGFHRQTMQNLRVRISLINEEIGTRFPEDMSQESKLRKRCKLSELPDRKPKPMPQQEPRPPPRYNPEPPPYPRTSKPRRNPKISYSGPTEWDFREKFDAAFNTGGKPAALAQYRKLTLQYHPDKHHTPIAKVRAEAAFKVLGASWTAFKARTGIAGGDYNIEHI